MPDRTSLRAHSAAVRRGLAGLLAAILLAGLAAAPMPAEAAGPKVVIVVGPAGSSTARYLASADAIAAQARAYGATVVKVYTPRATWARVRAAAQGARVLVYLGHGNGWPSPYGRFQPQTKDGLGLNAVYGGSRTGGVRYWGESYIRTQIRLAPGAVVLLNHLCYASGNGEPGSRQPSWTTARKRVDNFAYGFIGAGARAVIAEGHSDLSHELGWILGPGTRNLVATWRADWESNGNARSFTSARRGAGGYVNYLDPERTSAGFYRSLTTKSGFTVGMGGSLPTPPPTPAPTPMPTPTPVPTPAPTPDPAGSLTGTTTADTYLFRAPDRNAGVVAALPAGTRLAVIGPFVAGTDGRTYAPVRTPGGQAGYVSGGRTAFAGRATAAASIVVRERPAADADRVTTLATGDAATVTGSTDVYGVLWLALRTDAGATGWAVAVGMAP